MSLYQSKIWKTIQYDIYQNPYFKIKLLDKEYFGTIKAKKIWPITLKRYQILGFDLPKEPKKAKELLEKIKSEFKKDRTDIFFQLWITTPIKTFDVKDINPELSKSMRDARISQRHWMKERFHLSHSFRENLPESGIIYDLSKSWEELLKDMNKSSNLRTKKWLKNNIVFREIQKSEFDKFWNKRQETAGHKWFHTISKKQYIQLISHLIKTKTGNIFITEKDWEILSGVICIFQEKNLVCLYSFADRNFNNIWGQQYLKYKVFLRGKENWFKTCDMMWWAPSGFPEHELASVSAFKESMWWIKVEYIGNFDIIFNPFLYKLFKLIFRIRK